MRLLLTDDASLTPGQNLDRAQLRGMYAVPAAADRWLRVNFVSTLDGAVTGPDGLSGSINTPADNLVFQVLRELADAVLVGAGTAADEGYRRLVPEGEESRPAGPPLVLTSRRAQLPDRVAATRQHGGELLLATVESAPAQALSAARHALGTDQVLVCGEQELDLAAVLDALAGRGLRQILCEGGPHLFGSLLASGLVDELDLTLSPKLVASEVPRIASGPGVDVTATPLTLVEEDGTLIGRWLVG